MTNDRIKGVFDIDTYVLSFLVEEVIPVLEVRTLPLCLLVVGLGPCLSNGALHVLITLLVHLLHHVHDAGLRIVLLLFLLRLGTDFVLLESQLRPGLVFLLDDHQSKSVVFQQEFGFARNDLREQLLDGEDMVLSSVAFQLQLNGPFVKGDSDLIIGALLAYSI